MVSRGTAQKSASRSGLGRYAHVKRRKPKKQRQDGYKSYSEYIASDDWKAKRKQYLESDLPKACLACGSAEFELHHVTYDRVGFEFVSDLAPLCRCCHVKVHKCDCQAGKNDLAGLRKSLVYDFGIGTLEVDQLLETHCRARQREWEQFHSSQKKLWKERKPRRTHFR